MNRKDLEKLIGHKSHKFGAIRTVCSLGHSHPSKAEAMHCWSKCVEMKANLVSSLEYEKKYSLVVNGIFICNHLPDFTYIRVKDNKLCVDEVKGFQTSDWKLKSKLFQALYPHIEYRVVT